MLGLIILGLLEPSLFVDEDAVRRLAVGESGMDSALAREVGRMNAEEGLPLRPRTPLVPVRSLP